MNPAVSIVLPTFNRVHYLRPAIASVFAQTFDDWELLIADDGSSEQTVAYLRELESRESRVKLLLLAHTGRTSVVRNVALRVARGEYVAFLDSDDLWVSAKLEKQIESLHANPARSWSYSGFRMVNASLQPLGEIPFRPAQGWIVAEVLSFQTIIVQSSVVLSRRLLERTGRYDERLSLCSDLELWLRCALGGEADCIAEPLVWVRRHDEHAGDDIEACRDMNRALELIRPALGRRWGPELSKQRAIASATLARALAVAGKRRAAFATLFASASFACTEREWWRRAAGAAARALAPQVLRRATRRRM
ncbi:MAG: glycosyltransferase [Steroidobacteraceae bacterium]